MIVTKENLNITATNESKNFASFAFEPLPTGLGTTLGNSLRRVLLTSIEGAAITQAKIAGAPHQFTTLTGVKEDVVELTLNLKKVRIKIHGKNPVILTIKKKGPCVVTAGDIEVSSDAEVMNKDQVIATLADKNTELNMELVAEPGIGYSPMEERQSSKVGVIVIDAMFCPIKNVTYNVEPTRFGNRADLDKLILNVETDGSISPADSVNQAAQLLREFYETIVSGGNKIEEKVEVETKDSTSNSKTENVSVDELPLQTRTINALRKHGIESLHELAKKTDEELADIKNLGEKSLNEIKKLLKKEGFRA